MKQYDKVGSHLITHNDRTFTVDIYGDPEPAESSAEGILRILCHETDRVITKPYLSLPLHVAKRLIKEANWGKTGAEFVAELKKFYAEGRN
jgi:hypothetical protein